MRLVLRLSTCCFAEVFPNPKPKLGEFICTHCGAELNHPVVWPDNYIGGALELTIRQYKDGDVPFKSVSEAYEAEVDSRYRTVLDEIRQGTDNGKPPKYVYRIDQMEWLPAP